MHLRLIWLASACYGVLLFILVTKIPETQYTLDRNALRLKHLMHSYGKQFSNVMLISGGFLMGSATSYIYLFAAVVPFIAMKLLGMSSAEYGLANIFPAIGLVLGLITAAQLAKHYSLAAIMRSGILIASTGAVFMLLAAWLHLSAINTLFLPMLIIYFGLSWVLGNASTLAMSAVSDKAHGSAVMNFINMGFATTMVISLKMFSITLWVLPMVYIALCLIMLTFYGCAMLSKQMSS